MPGIRWDAKYATWDNFTGKPVDGYLANRDRRHAGPCAQRWTGRAEKAASLGFGLLLWDGYRPQRAVDCFLRWSRQPEDGRTKPRHYPNIDRAEMFEKGYVAAKSGHSRGGTVDLTLYELATGELAPMGGDHDLMDPISHHGATGITHDRSEKPAAPALHHGGLRLRLLRLRVVALHTDVRALSGHLLRFSHHVMGRATPHRDAAPFAQLPRRFCRSRRSTGSAARVVPPAAAIPTPRSTETRPCLAQYTSCRSMSSANSSTINASAAP